MAYPLCCCQNVGYNVHKLNQQQTLEAHSDKSWHQEAFAIGNQSDKSNKHPAISGTNVDDSSRQNTAGSDNCNTHDVNELTSTASSTASSTTNGSSARCAPRADNHHNTHQLLANALGLESAFGCAAVLKAHERDASCIEVVPRSHLSGPLPHKRVL